MKKFCCIIVISIVNLKIRKYDTLQKKTLILCIICSKCENEDKKHLKKQNQLRYYKFLVYLKIYDYFKSMTEGNISQELRLKKYR